MAITAIYLTKACEVAFSHGGMGEGGAATVFVEGGLLGRASLVDEPRQVSVQMLEHLWLA